MNAVSSRSHMIVTVHVVASGADGAADAGAVVRSKLNLVDLAGSERIKRTASTGAAALEAGFINKSLTFLEQVVVALGEGPGAPEPRAVPLVQAHARARRRLGRQLPHAHDRLRLAPPRAARPDHLEVRVLVRARAAAASRGGGGGGEDAEGGGGGGALAREDAEALSRTSSSA